MNTFTILPKSSWFTDPETKNRMQGQFIHRAIQAFYHSPYQGGNCERRETIGTVENIITTLKNQFKDKSIRALTIAGNNLITILRNDLPLILERTVKSNMTICITPRAKAITYYGNSQLVFKQAVASVAAKLPGFYDGTNYIVRHTDTRTTHLDKSGYGGIGDLPYPGITEKTCTISDDVKGKDILLIDDLYTETINIDEDAIQALINNGANSVVFYSLGKTTSKNL